MDDVDVDDVAVVDVDVVAVVVVAVVVVVVVTVVPVVDAGVLSCETIIGTQTDATIPPTNNVPNSPMATLAP